MGIWSGQMESMGLDKEFWKGKKILVTGHTGFKGCWLTLVLNKYEAKVIGYSLEKYPNDILFNECKLSEKIIDERGDIRNLKKIQSVFNKYKPEIVFHMAAQPLVRLSYSQPLETLDTNIMGTAHVLECIKNTESVKAAVIITSDKCYQNKEILQGYKETDRLGGKDIYSCSKGCAEIVTNAYKISFLKDQKKAIATARAGNVIGGGDYGQDRIIPDSVKSLKNNNPLEIRSPNATRPWQHVLEPIYGYLLLGEKLLKGEKVDEAWNFGPNKDSILPVKKMIGMFIKEWGSGEWKDVSKKENKLYESTLLSLDISKAVSKLKWKPKLDIKQTIKMTVEWYKNHNKNNSYSLCIKQIEEYERK